MKKIILLFTLTLIGAGQLYGMFSLPNAPQKLTVAKLPTELQREITQKAILSSNNLDGAIEMIKKFSVAFKVQHDQLFNNLKDFTILVHILAAQFKTSPIAVAQKFETEASKKYVDLYYSLENAALQSSDVAQVKELIAQGADVDANPALHAIVNELLEQQ